ncbi:MAG: hypothetical protein HND52_13450 [Ignavibacteriae bacterium]|nr:hypothetical protein [Ignavibacteriota bacterium]NOG98959.1 hypothetical protein [Ignavibacteriota bacterium]
MEFLKEVEFWIVLLLTAIFYILFFVSGYIKASWNMTLKKYTGFGIFAYMIFFFYQFGWEAGIFVLIFLLLWAFLSNPFIKYIARKLNPEAYIAFNIIKGIPKQKNSSSFGSNLTEGVVRAEKNILAVRDLEKDEKIISVLKKYNKPPSYIEEIYQILLACGTNNYIALKIASSPNHLNNYLELISKGTSDFDAAFKVAKEVS